MHKLIKTTSTHSNGIQHVYHDRFFYDGKMINEQRYLQLYFSNPNAESHWEVKNSNGKNIERFVTVFN